MKTLTYVITLANKKTEFFSRLIEEIKKIRKEEISEISFVLIYRDENEIYKDLIRDNFEIFEIVEEVKSKECKKVCKIFKILPKLNSKYVRFLDPDDSINLDNLKSLISELNKTNAEIVWNDAILRISQEVKSIYPWPLTNATTIFNVKELKNTYGSESKYDLLFSEDIFRSLFFGFKFKLNNGRMPMIKKISCPDIYYDINDESVSTEYIHRFDNSESVPNFMSMEWLKITELLNAITNEIPMKELAFILKDKNEFSKKLLQCIDNLTSYVIFNKVDINDIGLSNKTKFLIKKFISKYGKEKKSHLSHKKVKYELDKITLLITLYNPNEKEIQFWTKFYLKNFYRVRIHFLIDNPKLLLNVPIKDSDIFRNEDNIGKFKTIYNHIKGNKVSTPFFKVIDPDDGISLKYMKKIDFNLYKDNNIILFPTTRGREKNFTSEIEVENLIDCAGKRKWVSSFGNSWTILPTQPILNDIFYSGQKIYASDDQLLGFVALANGAEVMKNSNAFYWYVENNGNTNSINLKSYFENCITAFEEIRSIITLSGLKKYSNWPHDYEWFENKIKRLGHSKELTESLYKLKEIDIYENSVKNFDKNTLSIVFCSYKTQDDDVEYLNFLRQKLPENIQLIYAYDNKLSKSNIGKLSKNIDIFDSDENIGKFKLILKVSKIVKSKWFKVIDYDDSLNYYAVNKTIGQLRKIKDDTYPSHKAAKLDLSSKYYGEKLCDYESINNALLDSFNIYWSKIPNAKAFYSKEVCMKLNAISNKLTRQRYYDDDLLTLAHQGFFDKNKEIKSKIYIQNHQLGQSSTESLDDKLCAVEVIDNLLIINDFYKLNSKNFNCNSESLFKAISDRAYNVNSSSFKKEREDLKVKIDKLYND